MPKVKGLDTDGKLVLAIDPKHVKIDATGKVQIDNPELKKFLADKSRTIEQDLHLILMGSDCGCRCCC